MNIFLVVLRETLEYSFVLLLLLNCYRNFRRTLILTALVVITFGVAVTSVHYPLSDFLSKTYIGFMSFSFVILLLLSLISGESVIYPVLLLFLAFFFPSATLTSVIIDEIFLKGGVVLVYSFFGFVIGGGAFIAGLKYTSRLNLQKFFGLDGLFIFTAGFCFLFGGLNEFDHSPLITSLQRGFHVLFSSFIPFFKETLLIPDGTVVETSFDMILEYFSSQRVAMAVTALVLFLPPVFVFGKVLLTPEPETGGIEKRAEKRKVIAVYRDELIRKGTPLLLTLSVSIVLLHSANLALRPTYEPEPVPVIAEADTITIPLIDKLGDISDGKMRKFSFLHKGETYRFFVMMRPDGEVVAVLDACEICPPRGYVQRAEHVICKYCNTPIPTQSLGQPGGCNPIPINYVVEGDSLRVSKVEIVNAYQKEAGKETGSLLR